MHHLNACLSLTRLVSGPPHVPGLLTYHVPSEHWGAFAQRIPW